MHINSTLFREYDIRGRIDQPDELTPEAIAAIGRGFAVFLKCRGITDAVVGRDARPYSEEVKNITVKALCESGINVIDIGVVLAPMFYFSQYHLQKKGGVMITASHNPWGWSGFKHAYDYSTTLVPQDMDEMRDSIEKLVGDAVAVDLLTKGHGHGHLSVDEIGNCLVVTRQER